MTSLAAIIRDMCERTGLPIDEAEVAKLDVAQFARPLTPEERVRVEAKPDPTKEYEYIEVYSGDELVRIPSIEKRD